MDQKSQDSLLTILFTTGVIGFIVGVARGIIEQNHGGWLGFIRGICSALVVSALVGLGLADSTFPATMQACIIGVCAYISEDIVLGLRRIAAEVSKDPVGTSKAIIKAWRNRNP